MSAISLARGRGHDGCSSGRQEVVMRSPNPIELHEVEPLPLTNDTQARVRRVLDEALAELQLACGEDDSGPISIALN
jgi:hypothetical protein